LTEESKQPGTHPVSKAHSGVVSPKSMTSN